GDPVQRFRELKNGTPQERKDLISNFMALGHERNPDMLIDALKDPDTDVRVFAIESASALTEEESTRVLQAAAANDNPDAREMAWSIAAPYPMPSKVKIYGEALAKGSDANVEEAFEEMSITPEMPLFEMMIYHTLDPNLPDSRKQRLLKEMQVWLEPGGGDVPTFSDPKDLFEWWKANRENYDEFLLRVDQ
ncbi:MAG: HEAT repeat domain-containing protein, partial [Verrucomicrobiae bacterium]|nr:HEAT repeat domain-containing protein [Verrucomicrobiae bacterium]